MATLDDRAAADSPPGAPRAGASHRRSQSATCRYAVHLRRPHDMWSVAATFFDTRSAAQKHAAELLATAPAEPAHLGEVRLQGRLLDVYVRRGGTRVYHSFSAPLRERAS